MNSIDISRTLKDFFPQRGQAGLWASLVLLFLVLLTASGMGILGTLFIRQFVPVPAYVGVALGLFVLVTLLFWLAQHFHWITVWYYLLPAILFLLTFTVMPIGLTLFLAFTDYAGNRNAQLNLTTESAIRSARHNRVTVENAASLACDRLHQGCVGARIRLYVSGELVTEGKSLEAAILTLSEPLASGQEVTAAEVVLSDFGIRAQFPVVETDGATLILGRAPPGAVDLASVTLELAGASLERKITDLRGNTLTLNEPLPTLDFTSLARYNDFSWVGFENFQTILAQAGRSLLPVFLWTLAFATFTVVFNIALGVLLAVILNDPELRLRNLYRTLLIIPWAMPAIISIQIWRGLLNYNFGAINRVAALLGIPAVDWLGDPWAAKAAVLLVNLWLSFPFMMTATLGALSAIPNELYEAARIDGASSWQRFWNLTAPLLRSALVPIALTSFALSFNNFNVIFLLTDGGPAYAGGTSAARATDILISWAYNEAFRSQGGFAYGLGSAISILIFVITLAISLLNFRITGAFKEETV